MTLGGRTRSARAFTIVELLVVVAIIALLLAMLVPTIRQAKNQAVTMQCLSNMRQVSAGISGYATNYLGIVPNNGWVYSGNLDSAVNVWSSRSTPDPQYFPSAKAIRCPKNLQTPNTTANAFAQVQQNWNDPALISGQAPYENTGYHNYMKFNRVKYPVNYLILIDSLQLGGGPPKPPCYQIIPPGGPNPVWCFNPNYPRVGAPSITLGKVWDSGNWNGVWLPHGNRANTVFADMHAETSKLPSLYKLGNMTSLNQALAGTTPGGSYGAGSFFHEDGTCGPLTPEEAR